MSIPSSSIPYGYCQCGCGQLAPIARKTSSRNGWIRGQPQRYIMGHSGGRPRTPGFIVASPQATTGLCGCGCGGATPIAAQTRRRLGILKGQPLPFIPGHAQRKYPRRYHVEDRGYVTPCHIWDGRLSPKGYAIVDGHVNGHRWLWEEANGPVPPGKELDHRCSVRACIRLDHLEPVTHTENVRRGRHTKLTLALAEEIRASADAEPYLARRYGVCRTTIRLIKAGEIWKPEPAGVVSAS